MALKLVPEIVIYKTVRELAKIMKNDYNSFAAGKKQNTILHDLFYGIKLDSFDFYENAVAMFTKENDKRRLLEVTVGYNQGRAEMPTIHIILPSESPVVTPIGGNEGYVEEYEGLDENDEEVTSAVFTYESQVTYNLLVTSSNPLEAVLIYNWLKYCFVSIHVHAELMGLRNLKWGGSDLTFDESLLPNSVFHRNFNLTFDYEYSSRSFQTNKIGSKFIFESLINGE